LEDAAVPGGLGLGFCFAGTWRAPAANPWAKNYALLRGALHDAAPPLTPAPGRSSAPEPADKPAGELRFQSPEDLVRWLFSHPGDIVRCVVSLYRDGDVRGAERLGAAAVALYPDNSDVWFQYGMAAIHAGDRAKAAERPAAMRERFPDFAPSYSFGVTVLRHAGRVKEAEALARVTMARFPDDWRAFAEYAQCASRPETLDEVVRRAQVMRERLPDRPVGYWIMGGALLETGRLDEAEAVLSDGIARDPADALLLFVWARSATAREDWPEAARRWQLAKLRHPQSEQIKAGAAEVQSLREAQERAAGIDPAVFDDGAAPGTLLARFESLGDGSEFDIVQQLAGVAPQGLLSHATTSVANLAAML
jgi:tetratricopeptide (TPR) repeat protein